MKLFYTMGGGMGHLHRVSVFINQFRIEDFKILTSNQLAYRLFERNKILFIPSENYQTEIEQFFKTEFFNLKVTDFYLDAFPFGLLGELPVELLQSVKLHYLARRLNWGNYERFSCEIKFSTTYQMEPLEEAHLRFIINQTEELIPIELDYPASNPDRIPKDLLPDERPIWLIVHTFKKEEIESLMHYAEEVATLQQVAPFFVVLSDHMVDVPNGICIFYFPAADWFPLADHIFAGAGFSTVIQIRPFLHKSTLIPFPRSLDDQVWRAKSVQNIQTVQHLGF